MVRKTAIVAIFLMLSVTAMAQIPRVMTYQGILLDSEGNPVDNGNYSVTFRIYDPDGGLLWTETDMVSTQDGYFAAELGHTNPLNLPFSEPYYLSLQVQEDDEMPQLQLLTLSAYAARSDTSQVSLSAQTADDADLLDGLNSTDFAPAIHDHDADYVNENQPDAITSSMIANSQIVNADISPSANIAASKINDGSGSGLNADLLDDLNSTDFASSTHDHDADYVNENQANSVSSDMIADDQIVDADISSGANISASKINDGTDSGLDADLLDGLNSSDFLNTGSDYGRSGVAADLYEGTSTLTDRYINNDRPDTLNSFVANGPGLVVNQHYAGTSLIANSESGNYSATGISGSADITGGYDVSDAIGINAHASNNSPVADNRAFGGYFTASSNPIGTHFGVYGESDDYGVYGHADNGWGVYYSGGLAGSGTKSCVVKTSKGPTLLYCQESPENWFEDFGEGQLQGGRTHIELDQLFLETVTIDAVNPMKVFVQLEGDCNGVYVSKGLSGFDVIELANGASNVPFSYRVVAKRSGFENRRLDYTETGLTDPYLYPENAREMPDPRGTGATENRGAR
jgi:hypothetical protein